MEELKPVTGWDNANVSRSMIWLRTTNRYIIVRIGKRYYSEQPPVGIAA